MTLLDRILARGLEFPSDPIIAARVERHLRRIQPDPLFRRRLRSVVVNHFVATREGLALPASARPVMARQMGFLGRGVLLASLLTAVGVTAVGAASQGSLPGDALYGVKLELEQIRMQVAPPGLRDDLAAMALDERLDEVEQLAAAGRWDLVDGAANRALQAEAALLALSPSAAGAERHAQRLTELLAIAPASALDGLQRALEASTAPHATNGKTGDGRSEIGGTGTRAVENAGGGGNQSEQPGPSDVPQDPRGSGNGSQAGSGSDGSASGSGPGTENGGYAGGSQDGHDGSIQDQGSGKQ